MEWSIYPCFGYGVWGVSCPMEVDTLYFILYTLYINSVFIHFLGDLRCYSANEVRWRSIYHWAIYNLIVSISQKVSRVCLFRGSGIESLMIFVTRMWDYRIIDFSDLYIYKCIDLFSLDSKGDSMRMEFTKVFFLVCIYTCEYGFEYIFPVTSLIFIAKYCPSSHQCSGSTIYIFFLAHKLPFWHDGAARRGAAWFPHKEPTIC